MQVNENHDCDAVHPGMSHKEWQKMEKDKQIPAIDNDKWATLGISKYVKESQAMREAMKFPPDTPESKATQKAIASLGDAISKARDLEGNLTAWEADKLFGKSKEEKNEYIRKRDAKKKVNEGKTEFAVVAKASGMLIKAFPKGDHARQYIKNKYSQRKNLRGNLGVIEVPKSRAPGNDMKKHGKIEVMKESVKKIKKKMLKIRLAKGKEIGWEMKDAATGKVLKKGGPPVK